MKVCPGGQEAYAKFFATLQELSKPGGSVSFMEDKRAELSQLQEIVGDVSRRQQAAQHRYY